MTNNEVENLERLQQAVEAVFEIPDDARHHAAQESICASQAELDAKIHQLKQCKIPGLKRVVADAIIYGDTETVATVAQTAREQAIIAEELRMCRRAVTMIMTVNKKQSWHKNSTIVQKERG